MSGPNAPPMIKMAMQAMRPQPAPRSDASQRIMAGRQMGVPQEQLVQRPGFRPSGAMPPAQAAPPRPATPPPSGGPTPMPTARPQPAPQAAAPQQAGAPAISSADFIKKALEMEAAKRNVPLEPVKAGPPVTRMEDFMGQVKAMEGRKPQMATPGVREASPDEIKAAQQREMAQQLAARRSGGDKQAAPAGQGAVTPPAPSVAPSPVPPPPPVGIQPRGDMKSSVDMESKKFKYPKSTQKQSSAYGSSQNYYAILGVDPGDNVAANTALQKLREKEKKSPEKITMEEDKILAASYKIPAYNKSLEPKAIQQRFDERSKRAAAEEGGEAPAQKGPQQPSAEAIATAAIDRAGAPATKKAPTQEDVNKNPGAYTRRNSANVEGDTAVQATEDEE